MLEIIQLITYNFYDRIMPEYSNKWNGKLISFTRAHAYVETIKFRYASVLAWNQVIRLTYVPLIQTTDKIPI